MTTVQERPLPPTADPRVELVARACREIEAAERAPSLAELGRAVGASPDRVRRAFAAVLGVSPHQYADGLRLDRLRGELRDGTPVSIALFAAGYGSPSRLYEGAHARLGMTPASYGAGGRGAAVTYAVAPSALGWVCVGVTDRGVCHIGLGDDEADAARGLAAALPEAVRERDDDALRAVVEEVLRRVHGQEPHAQLPIDVQGSAFQRRVWAELQRIPRGETRTYAEVAAAVGAPGAARAVGRACATNPVAVVVPCHRVVRADRAPGGYAWGPERKAALLAAESGPAEG